MPPQPGPPGDLLVVLHPDEPLVLVGGAVGPSRTTGQEVSPGDPPIWPDLLSRARLLVPAGAWPLGPARLRGKLRVHVMQARSASVAPGCRWSGTPDPAGSEPVRRLVAAVLDQDAGRAPTPPQRVAWMRRGWWAGATRWVDEQLAGLGRRRVGDLEPVEHWATSAVALVPTEGGRAWLKAVPPMFAREPAVLALLDGCAPGRVPRLLAVDLADEGARFLMQDAGEVPDDIADQDRPALAEVLARVLAELQVRALDLLPQLAAAGCVDRSPPVLVAELDRLVRDGFELDQLGAGDRVALLRRLPQLGDQLRALADGPLPPVLIHGDYHPWNVAHRRGVGGPEAAIIDWTDAAIGPAGTDLLRLLHPGADAPTCSRMRTAYAQVWAAHQGSPLAETLTAVTAAGQAAHVVQAIAHDQIQRSVEPDARWQLSGMMARHLRALAAPESP